LSSCRPHRDLAPDHSAHELDRRDLVAPEGADALAAAQHRDPVGDTEHLVSGGR